MPEVQTETPKSSAKTVTVGCKMPNGLKLRLFKMEPVRQLGIGGTVVDTKEARITRSPDSKLETVTLNGFSLPHGPSRKAVEGGFGLTFGVPADFMDEWMKQNADTDLVRSGLVFVSKNRDEAEAQARDKEGIRSNLEPLDPGHTFARDGRIVPNDPRSPRSINANLSAVQTAERD